jgi:hypothetical protein
MPVLTTPEGWWLIIVGCGVGFLFALVALCISVVSFPLMLDRHAGVGDAMVTVSAGRCTKPDSHGHLGIDRCGIAGGGIASVLLRPCRRAAAARPRDVAPLCKVVAPDPNQPPIPPRPPRERRPAVDFPANLFPWKRKGGTQDQSDRRL